MKRKLRMGMIGGGPGAFIGDIHRKAAAMDGMIELVAGAFSSDPKKSRTAGKALGLSPQRVYPSFEDMLRQEKQATKDRLDFVSIVTPNYLHFAPAKMAMESGFHVIMDKPITLNLTEAKKLRDVVRRTGKLFALTHTYTGYPMIKKARSLVASRKLGAIRKIYIEYSQGWLASRVEASGNKQAVWRTDPAKAGLGGALGDIGTHAANLAEYVSGARITSVCAQLNRVVSGRKLDDDVSMLLEFSNQATGVLVATQIAAGEENNLCIKVYGEKGGMVWRQEEPNTLEVKWLDRPREVYRAGSGYLSKEAGANCRTPGGHPEGYLEAFANIYVNFTNALQKPGSKSGKTHDFPTVEDGIRGMAFIEAAVRSSASRQKWTKIKS